MKKKLLIIVSVLAVLLIIIILCRSRLYDYDEVASYVRENQKALQDITGKEVPPALSKDNKKFVKDLLGNNTIVKRISDEKSIIVFTCGTSGGTLGYEKTGFYYSEKDNFDGLEFFDLPFKESGNERIYDAGDGESYLRTVKITDHWYYFHLRWY